MVSCFTFLWNIFGHSFWSVIIGVVIVLVFVGLIGIIIQATKPRARFSVLGLCIGAVMAVLLVIQVVPAVSAFRLKSEVNEMRDSANSLIINILAIGGGTTPQLNDPEQINQAIDLISENYPFITQFIGDYLTELSDSGQLSLTGIVDSIADSAIDWLNDIILKSLLIALIEAAIGCSLIYFTMENAPSGGRRGGAPCRANNNNHTISRNGKSHSYRTRRHRL